jgi:hypothetical protein
MGSILSWTESIPFGLYLRGTGGILMFMVGGLAKKNAARVGGVLFVR